MAREVPGKIRESMHPFKCHPGSSQEATYVGRTFTTGKSRCSASSPSFAFLWSVVRRTHWFPRYVTNAIDRELGSRGSRGSLGSAPAVVGTGNGSRARTLFPLPHRKNFRVDCLVFRISERPRFPTRTYNVSLSIHWHDAMTKNRDTKERYLVGDKSVIRKSTVLTEFIRVSEKCCLSIANDTNIYFVITRCIRIAYYTSNVLWLCIMPVNIPKRFSIMPSLKLHCEICIVECSGNSK